MTDRWELIGIGKAFLNQIFRNQLHIMSFFTSSEVNKI